MPATPPQIPAAVLLLRGRPRQHPGKVPPRGGMSREHRPAQPGKGTVLRPAVRHLGGGHLQQCQPVHGFPAGALLPAVAGRGACRIQDTLPHGMCRSGDSLPVQCRRTATAVGVPDCSRVRRCGNGDCGSDIQKGKIAQPQADRAVVPVAEAPPHALQQSLRHGRLADRADTPIGAFRHPDERLGTAALGGAGQVGPTAPVPCVRVRRVGAELRAPEAVLRQPQPRLGAGFVRAGCRCVRAMQGTAVPDHRGVRRVLLPVCRPARRAQIAQRKASLAAAQAGGARQQLLRRCGTVRSACVTRVYACQPAVSQPVQCLCRRFGRAERRRG